MANIGEIEFLVKFDSMNQSFKKVLGEALEGMELGEGSSQKLDEIKSHLNLLVVNYSGSRTVDMVRAGGHLKQLESEEFLERKTEAMFGNSLALEKIGLAGLETGTKETKDAVREVVRGMHADTAALTAKAMSSDINYLRYMPKVRSAEAYMELGTEGTTPHVIGKLMEIIRPEFKVIQSFLKKQKEDYGDDFDYAKGETWWNKLTGNLGKGDKPLDSQQAFYDAIMKHLDDPDAFKDIFFGGAGVLKGELEKKWISFLEEYTLKKEEIALPRSLLKTAKEDYGKQYDSDTYFRSDMRILLKDKDMVRSLIEGYTPQLNEDEREDLIDRIEKAINTFEYYFLTGEGKTIGTIGKRKADESRLTPGMRKEGLNVSAGGTEYGTFTKSITEYTSKEIKDLYEKGKLETMIKSMANNQNVMTKSLEYLASKSSELPAELSEKIKRDLETLQVNIKEIKFGDY